MAQPETTTTVPVTAPTNQAERGRVPKVPCPKCGGWQSAVKDGRASDRGYKRKRECQACGKQFFTIEQAA